MSDYYEGPSWAVAETEMLRYGVVDYREAVDAARSAGVTPVYVLACVDFYRENRAKFNPSDLRDRIAKSATYLDPDDLSTWKVKGKRKNAA